MYDPGPVTYFLLHRDDGRVVACDGTRHIEVGYGIPECIAFRGRVYRRVPDELMFWDEFRDAEGRSVGYELNLPSEVMVDTIRLWGCPNAVVATSEAKIILTDYPNPRLECVQGFTHFLFRNDSDPSDSLLFLLDWSENPIAFELRACPE